MTLSSVAQEFRSLDESWTATGSQNFVPDRPSTAKTDFVPDRQPNHLDKDVLSAALAASSPIGAAIADELQAADLDLAAEEVALVRKEAFAAGRDAANAEYEGELQAAKRLVAGLESELDAKLASISSPMVDAAMAIVADLARQIVGEEIAASPASVKARVETALRSGGGLDGTVALHVHPDDVQFFNGQEEFTVSADHDLSRGDFRLETDAAGIDGSVEAALATKLGDIS
ncbi:MAG: FliH/SctL family protein [Pacificimonas sp.]